MRAINVEKLKSKVLRLESQLSVLKVKAAKYSALVRKKEKVLSEKKALLDKGLAAASAVSEPQQAVEQKTDATVLTNDA